LHAEPRLWCGAILAAIAPEARGKVKQNSGGFPRGKPRTTPQSMAWRFLLFSLKGWNMTAQGNALGTVVVARFVALKGRNNMLIEGGTAASPSQHRQPAFCLHLR
jgi:hypothetical protein